MQQLFFIQSRDRPVDDIAGWYEQVTRAATEAQCR